MPDAPWRPRVWVAVALSILLPGLGHLYAGRPARGLVLLAALHLFAAAAVVLALDAPGAPLRLLLILLILLIVATAAPADAARQARRASAGPRRPYQRWLVLAAVWLAAAFVGPSWFIRLIERYVAGTLEVRTAAMDPTLLAGDRILVRRRVPRALEHGAVVVHRGGAAAGEESVLRVVGVPGDTLEMRGFHLRRNGAPADEPYPLTEGGSPPAPPGSGDWGPVVVPRDSLLLLGDDRAHGDGGRFLGLIPRGSVAGTPAWIYFSRDPATGETRMDRIGLRVE